MEEWELLKKLNEGNFRYSIHKGEMPVRFLVDIIIYHGMGNFKIFKAEGTTFKEAASEVLRKYENNEDAIYEG